MHDRVGDKRVLGVVKAFLKAGILTEGGAERDTTTGTPQGGIATAPTQSQTSSLSVRFGAVGGGVCREL